MRFSCATRGKLMAPSFPEVTTQGLILWRVRHSAGDQLWCAVTDQHGELELLVCSPVTDQTPHTETHLHVTSLLQRANVIRDDYVTRGWQLVDVDFDEPD